MLIGESEERLRYLQESEKELRQSEEADTRREQEKTDKENQQRLADERFEDLRRRRESNAGKMYRTTGPLVPENFWGCQKIFWQRRLPQFSRVIVVYVTNKGHIHRYICNAIKPHAMTIYGFMFHAQMYCSLIFDRV